MDGYWEEMVFCSLFKMMALILHSFPEGVRHDEYPQTYDKAVLLQSAYLLPESQNTASAQNSVTGARVTRPTQESPSVTGLDS